MAFDRFLISPINTGLQTNLKPWQIMDDAFERLNNAYVFRGRVRKRFGSYLMGQQTGSTAQLFSRLRMIIGTTDGSGNFVGTVPGSIFAVGQAFSVGVALFTVYQSGTPAPMLSTSMLASGTYNTSNGQVTISGAIIDEQVYWYPSEPVLGFTNYQLTSINNAPLYAFDTQFAYVFQNTSGWQGSNNGVPVTAPIWHDPSGDKDNYFWSYNWEGITANNDTLFVTNFQVTNFNGSGTATDDPLWSFNGGSWSIFTPYIRPNGGAPSTGPFIKTCRIIVAFKDRLLLLNTVENDNSGGNGNNTWFANRCRYSFNGSPFAVNAWYEPNQVDSAGNAAAGSGFLDASTDEQIVSAEFIKDRLIVYFERSTWELAYTGNQVLPFVWQKINTELGSESTFSSVPFDKVVLTIGQTGVHACSGANVERIDQKIPDEIFEIQDKDQGFTRIVGIRDYYAEMVYWSFPPDTTASVNQSFSFPERVLVYNYQNSSWAFNDDVITAFGYLETQSDITWVVSPYEWQATENTWISGVQNQQFRQVVGGNQEGYTFIISADDGENASVMQITNMTATGGGFTQLTMINHCSNVGDYLYIENAQNVDPSFNTKIYQVISLIDSNNLVVNAIFPSGFYSGGGQAKRVSNIEILTKQFNPYIDKGFNVFIQKVDFGVTKTSAGEITVDYFPSSSNVSMIQDGTQTGAIMGTGILETSPYNILYAPLEQFQTLLWHPLYFQTTGEFIQLYFSFSADEITTPNIAFSDFELQGMILHTKPTSTRLQ